MTGLRIRILGRALPGRTCGSYEGVKVGLQGKKPQVVLGVVSGDAKQATWETEATVATDKSGRTVLRGESIQGRGTEQFLYLSWLASTGEEKDAMFRRAKLWLDAVPPEVMERALTPGHVLMGELELTDECGMPRCAAVRPPLIRWFVERG